MSVSSIPYFILRMREMRGNFAGKNRKRNEQVKCGIFVESGGWICKNCDKKLVPITAYQNLVSHLWITNFWITYPCLFIYLFINF
jgi:hypothetical protein